MTLPIVTNSPLVYADHIKIGDTTIPIGQIKTSAIYVKDFKGKEIHTVRIWTYSAMKLQGKEVILDFQLRTAEKTQTFFQDLIKIAGASFSLSVSSIKPDLLSSDNRVKGVIHIKFNEIHQCEEFNSAIAPVFFTEFEKSISDTNVILTSKEGKKKEIIKIMNASFALLNKQTHFQIGDLLSSNGDTRFSAEKNPNLSRNCPPQRHPHYYIGLDGTVKKERAHKGPLPKDHFQAWDETNNFYFAPEPLEKPSQDEINKTKRNISYVIKYQTEICKISQNLDQQVKPDIEWLEDTLKKCDSMSAFEWELFFNKFKKLDVEVDKLTQEEIASLNLLTIQLEEEINDLDKEVEPLSKEI